MRLATFVAGDGERLGALVADGFVLDLQAAAALLNADLPSSLQQLIEGGPALWDRAREVIARAPEQALVAQPRLHAPLPRPVRMRDCQLILAHLEAVLAKLGREMSPEYYRQVLYYNADNVHVFGPDDDIPWPRASQWIDYELEWACILGRPGVNIKRDEAVRHIFGYTLFNDWSARDLQFTFQEGNLGPGGGKDFATSLGPCVVTADEIPNPYDLRMSADINGELWSSGSTASMHWRFEDAIHQLSQDRPLVAGEVLASGTVLSGCGLELGRRLAIGDVVELKIPEIGILRNRVVAPLDRLTQFRAKEAGF